MRSTLCLFLSSLCLFLLAAMIFSSSGHVTGLSPAPQEAASVRVESETTEGLGPCSCCANSKPTSSSPCCAQESCQGQRGVVDGLDSRVASLSSAPQEATSVRVELETTEGCECVAPCPCASREQASFDRCRALKFYQVQSGVVDGHDLKGLVFVAAISDSPKRMFELRDWRGALYLPEGPSEAQRKALRRVADNIWRGVYRGFEKRVAALTYVRNGDAREATIGKLGHLSTAPLLGPDGVVKRFPKNPKSKSAVSVRNHFDDGKVKWDLADRSARVAPMAVLESIPYECVCSV